MQVKATHLTTLELMHELRGWSRGSELISDAAAVTIAAQLQTSGGHGAVFAALASGAPVSKQELSAAIEAEHRSADSARVQSMLTALAEWSTAQQEEAPGPIEGLRLAVAQVPDDAVIVIEDTAGCKYALREVNGILDVSLKDGANSTTLHLVIEEVRSGLTGPGWKGGTS